MGQKRPIQSHRELEVYQLAFQAAKQIFEITQRFPKEERYSLIDQIRRSSRSVCANLGEAWRKRRYPNAFVYKLNEVESEAAETQVWLEFSVECKYMAKADARVLYQTYDQIISKLVRMINHPEPWLLSGKKRM